MACCAMLRLPQLVGLILIMSACGSETPPTSSGAPESEEAGPAQPCSINGMLFRDTAAVEFKQCGEAAFPVEGEVAACMRIAMESKAPFVVLLKTARPTPAFMRPALVGADFGGRYQLRMYVSDVGGTGRRTNMNMVMTDATSQQLSFMNADNLGAECVMSEAQPAAQDQGWANVDAKGEHRFNPRSCVEWFDAAAWATQPWDSKFSEAARVACVATP